MNEVVWIPDQLWHKFKRTFPHADVPALLRGVMLDMIKQEERDRERDRWAAAGVTGEGLEP